MGKLYHLVRLFLFVTHFGPAKPEEGYQKAETFDNDGDIVQEYGGGKCQVSSTLFNAVRNVPGIEIVKGTSIVAMFLMFPKGTMQQFLMVVWILSLKITIHIQLKF